MRPLLFLPIIALTACDTLIPQQDDVEPDLVFFFEGYRDEADQCRQLAETAYTGFSLDDAADLVGCPEGMENLDVFAVETGGLEVARKDGFVLYSVPRR